MTNINRIKVNELFRANRTYVIELFNNSKPIFKQIELTDYREFIFIFSNNEAPKATIEKFKYLFECEVDIEKGMELEIYNNDYEVYNIKIFNFEIKYECNPYLEIKIEGAPFNVMYMQLIIRHLKNSTRGVTWSAALKTRQSNCLMKDLRFII